MTINQAKMDPNSRQNTKNEIKNPSYSFSKKRNLEANHVDSLYLKQKAKPDISPTRKSYRAPKEETRIRPLYDTPRNSSRSRGRIVTPVMSTKSKINPLAFISNTKSSPKEQIVLLRTPDNQRRVSYEPEIRRPPNPVKNHNIDYSFKNTPKETSSIKPKIPQRRTISTPASRPGSRRVSYNPSEVSKDIVVNEPPVLLTKPHISPLNLEKKLGYPPSPVDVSKHVYFKNSNPEKSNQYLNTKGQVVIKKRILKPNEREFDLNKGVILPRELKQNTPVILSKEEESIHLIDKKVQTSTPKQQSLKIPSKNIKIPQIAKREEEISESSLPIKLFPRDPTTQKTLYKSPPLYNKKPTPRVSERLSSERTSYDPETPDYSHYYFKDPTSIAATNYTSNPLSQKPFIDKEVNFSDYAEYWELADKINYAEYISDSDLPDGVYASGIGESSFNNDYYTSDEPPFYNEVYPNNRDYVHKTGKEGYLTPVRYNGDHRRKNNDDQSVFRTLSQVNRDYPNTNFSYKKPPIVRKEGINNANPKRKVEKKRGYIPSPESKSYRSSHKSHPSSYSKYYVTNYNGKREHSEARKYTKEYDLDNDYYYESKPERKGRVVYSSPQRRENYCDYQERDDRSMRGNLNRKVQSLSKNGVDGIKNRLIRGNNTSKKDLLRRKLSQKSISFRASESPEGSPKLKHNWKIINGGERGLNEYEVPLRKFDQNLGDYDNTERFVIPSVVYARPMNVSYQ